MEMQSPLDLSLVQAPCGRAIGVANWRGNVRLDHHAEYHDLTTYGQACLVRSDQENHTHARTRGNTIVIATNYILLHKLAKYKPINLNSISYYM